MDAMSKSASYSPINTCGADNFNGFTPDVVKERPPSEGGPGMMNRDATVSSSDVPDSSVAVS